jgi:hypothetical protein
MFADIEDKKNRITKKKVNGVLFLVVKYFLTKKLNNIGYKKIIIRKK